MIIQACINGIRDIGFHPRVPTTIDEILNDSKACIAAGANEVHVHPRNEIGQECLNAVNLTIRALRIACPGTLIGVSTGAWIENDISRTRDALQSWDNLPDYASVNLGETDAPAIMDILLSKGVGVEAGLATLADAERFAALGNASRVFRILIEIAEQDCKVAIERTEGILEILREHQVDRSILIHGEDSTMWQLAKFAIDSGYSTRIGLEDGKHLPNGAIAKDNAELIRAAIALAHQIY